ncbi:Uncharacterised protein [Mycobacteroides abscessus]|nr:Uncharacterised protein [Mycobacteroides abscessus]
MREMFFTSSSGTASVVDLEVAQCRVALGLTLGQGRAPHVIGLLGQEEDGLPAFGDLGGERDVLGAERRDQYRDAVAHRVVDQLQGLAEAGALLRGERHGEVLALELEALAAPHLATDLDGLAGAAQRCVVLDAVEPLDHLGARGADAEDEPAARDVVQAGRGHGQQSGGAGVQLEDARRELYGGGLGGEVSELACGVIRVSLGDERDIQTDFLQLSEFVDHFGESAGVAQRGSNAHAATLPDQVVEREGAVIHGSGKKMEPESVPTRRSQYGKNQDRRRWCPGGRR